MDSADRIRLAVANVNRLRLECQMDPRLNDAVRAIKQLQEQRFAATYSDLLCNDRFSGAARFFLIELYGDKDYQQRDDQFARIAGSLQKVFPSHVTATAVALAELHALTENLDHQMGKAWLRASVSEPIANRYVDCWREVGQEDERNSQLKVVLGLGDELSRLTRTPGLRLMLRMMRAPAAAAGLGALQTFLESGFDTFAQLAKQPSGVSDFLTMIEQREQKLITSLFTADFVACATELGNLLGQAR